jgi:hypothetical protein
MPDARVVAARDFIHLAGDLLDDAHPDDEGARREAMTLLEDAAANAKSMADEIEAGWPVPDSPDPSNPVLASVLRDLGLYAVANDVEKGRAGLTFVVDHVQRKIVRLEGAGTAASEHAPGTVGEADAIRRGVWCDKARRLLVSLASARQPRVYSRRKGAHMAPADAVYVGRPSEWGNPFTIGKDGDRDEVIAKYREYVTAPERAEMREAIRQVLGGKDLVCWCAPKPCHADVLLEIANPRLQSAGRTKEGAWNGPRQYMIDTTEERKVRDA